MGVAIRVSCVLALGACGDAKSTTSSEGEPPPAIPAPKVEAALASIVATCAKCESTEVRRKGKPYWEPIALGGTFRDGDWIRTSATGSARIRFVSGGHLDLDQKTTLFVEADTAKRAADGKVVGVHVAIQSGGASGVLEGGRDAPIALRTNEGEVRIAGTTGASSEFRLEPTTDGAVDVVVSKGELVVRNGANERRIEAEKPEPVAPKPPVVPKRYVPRPPKSPLAFPQSSSPKIDARFVCAKGLRIPLAWQPVTGAAGYRVIIARDMSFRSVVAMKDQAQTTFTFAPPTPGTYVWRVAARDWRGYSEFGFARRIFCAGK